MFSHNLKKLFSLEHEYFSKRIRPYLEAQSYMRNNQHIVDVLTLAYHENRCVVACIHLGLRFKVINVRIEDMSIRFTLLKSLMINPELPASDRFKRKIEKYIVLLLAGKASERKLTKPKYSQFDGEDSENINYLTSQILNSKTLSNALYKYSEIYTKTIFIDLDTKQNQPIWGCLKLVASLFADDTKLSYQEVLRAVDFHE